MRGHQRRLVQFLRAESGISDADRHFYSELLKRNWLLTAAQENALQQQLSAEQREALSNQKEFQEFQAAMERADKAVEDLRRPSGTADLAPPEVLPTEQAVKDKIRRIKPAAPTRGDDLLEKEARILPQDTAATASSGIAEPSEAKLPKKPNKLPPFPPDEPYPLFGPGYFDKLEKLLTLPGDPTTLPKQS